MMVTVLLSLFLTFSLETLLLLTPIEKFDEEGQDYPCILAVSNKCVYDYVNTGILQKSSQNSHLL